MTPTASSPPPLTSLPTPFKATLTNMKKAFEYFLSTPSQPPAGSARLTSTPREVYLCGPNVVYNASKDTTRRISFETPTIMIYGYPSRGGVIILEDASPTDLEFLALDRMDPPMFRHEDAEDEDLFCQRLLLLGPKWWDSLARYWLLNGEEVDRGELDESDEPVPTGRERCWISVAWPSAGGFVVSEFDTNMWGVEIEKELVPEDVARLRLCTSMDEKARILKERFRGKVWEQVEDYRGNAFIGCWGWKETGEVGEFQKTWEKI
ncbi:uncharacterized protein EI97DRAFT_436730 [Westerdykella ornata]|uniref:Uncharacterized protein n=1 Tax=Westerdykella ornata TaxID=318751 RepID=A0A6A6J8E9_WESOR|nr:uncharacterized protein EI97DRAFT_436730 [Westerdykella ornata]KAF2272645.1 hypothetical protein EI97DRAFT_436730 [Westerdykella ornata]